MTVQDSRGFEAGWCGWAGRRAADEEGRASEQMSERLDERAGKRASGEQADGKRLHVEHASERGVSGAQAEALAAVAREAARETEARAAA